MSEPLPPYTRRDTDRPGWTHNYSHPSDVPPSYADSVRWFFYNSLQPAYLFISLVSAIAAIFLCAIEWRSMSDSEGIVQVLCIVPAVLFTVCTVLQIFAFVAGLGQRIHLLRLAVRLSVVSMGLALAAIIIALANVYANKESIFAQCRAKTFAALNGPMPAGTASVEDEQNVNDYCQYSWNEDAVWDIVWLILILIFSVVYVSLAYRFLRKVENPGFAEARTRPLPADGRAFDAQVDETNTYAMDGLPRRASRDKLVDDEALVDAKMDPMADVYGGRRDHDEPLGHAPEARAEHAAFHEPTIRTVPRAAQDAASEHV
ncbi:hypothetical protein MOBT1_002723 [Malassezia obtusa]|uniref:Transmembrane protein n=1 Tax=Malassezia obtusa TaxID=76774 RepID=A0AAF0IXF2_9BASI|nr:hypothetical protein MOBT1_002723 [Malassezia obtusa]